jgi:putative flippase GtrA
MKILRYLMYFRDANFSKIFLRYFVAALFGAAFDYSTFMWLYGLTANIFISNMVGFLIGTTINFFICRHYVFNEKSKGIKAIASLYIMTYMVVLINTFYIQYAINFVGIHTAKISSFAISYVLNFGVRKYFVFSKGNYDK